MSTDRTFYWALADISPWILPQLHCSLEEMTGERLRLMARSTNKAPVVAAKMVPAEDDRLLLLMVAAARYCCGVSSLS